MPLLINRELVDNDSWQLVDAEALENKELSAGDIPAGDIIVPLAFYQENSDALNSRDGQVAIQLAGGDEIDGVLENPNQFPLIAIFIPALRDGRAFSIARLLKRAGFEGQIRAVGDVTHDRLDFLTRCGFDALEIPADRFSDEVFNAFSEFSVRYQGCEDDSRPVYRQ